MTNQPTVKPFRYVHIPVDSTAEVSERVFSGSSEAEVRAELTRHFRSLLLSEAQKKTMSQHIAEEAKRNMEKHRRDRNGNEEESAAPVVEEITEDGGNPNTASSSSSPPSSSAVPPVKQEELIDQYLEHNSYEVVPVVMPTRKSQFIGTSLYVDDCGQFKGLEINSRASRIAQREIRGDAFLLSNHDDPALEDWERVDTTLDQYQALHQDPPKNQVDPHNAAQMAQMTQFRESESKRIEEEDVVKAATAKAEGNTRVSKGNWDGAVEAYSVAIELTTGRRDLLKNEAEATALRLSSLLNRSLSYAKLRKFAEAEQDAEAALLMEPTHAKALYRLAQAQIGLQEFEKANATVTRFEAAGGSEEDVRALQQGVAAGAQAYREKQKKMFGKLFA